MPSSKRIESIGAKRREGQRMLSLRDLFETMSAISSVSRLHDLLPHLARFMASSIGAQRCTVYLYDAGLSMTTHHFRWGYSPAELDALDLTDSYAGPLNIPAERHVITTRKVLQRIPGELEEDLLPTNAVWRDSGWRGDMMVPFIWNDHIEGVAIILLPDGTERFDPLQMEVAQGVAQQAAGVINNLRAMEAERQSSRQTEMLLDLSRRFNSAGSTSEIYSALADGVREMLGTDAVSIVVQETSQPSGDRTFIRRVAALGMTADETDLRDRILASHNSLGSTIDRIAGARHDLVIIDVGDDTVDDPELRESFKRHGITELLAAPIDVAGELRGVLYSWSRNGAVRLDRGMLAVAGTMTRHAAASIERVLLVEFERRQREKTQLLADFNRALAGTEDPADLIQIATGVIRRTLKADLATAHVYENGPANAATVFTDGATDEEIAVLLRDAGSSVGDDWQIGFAGGERVLPISVCSMNAVSPDPHLQERMLSLGAQRAVAVRVDIGDRYLGVIQAWYRSADVSYRQTDLETVETMAAELSSGLDRAALLASERHERTLAEALLSFSKRLNMSAGLDEVHTSIVETMQRLFPDAHVAIGVVRHERQAGIDMTPELHFDGHDHVDDLLHSVCETGVAESRQVGPICMVASPLTVGEDVLGAMIVARSDDIALTEDELALLAGLAPQAADAIRRARLFAVAERHIADLTLLQEVGRTISTRQSLPEIFSYIANEIRNVVDYSAGLAALEGHVDGYLEAVSVWGTIPAENKGRQIPVDRSIMGGVYRSHEPVIVHDVENHPGAWDKPNAVWRSLICVPLMIGSRSIGAMLLGHQDAGAFSEEDVRLASLLAGQAGAAIYQARESKRQRELYRAGVEALASAVDAKDSYIHSHSRQVAEFSRRTAEALGLGSEEVERIELAGLLHDVGKIGIPDHILTKPGRLDPQERLIMIGHATLGARIVAAHPSLAMMSNLVLHHHEWHNGSGYPDGLRGDEVPLGSAIISVADAFDSMTSFRPYRNPLSYDAAREELSRWSGTQFHPAVVEAFLETLGEDPEPRYGALPDSSMALAPIQALDIVAPRVLSQIATEISHLTDLYPFLDRVQQIICQDLKYDEVHILLVDEADGQLMLAASTTHPELVGRYRILPGEGISGHAVQSRLVVNCGDVTVDPRARPTDLGTRSVLAVPVIVDDEVIGVLGSGSAEPDRYEDHDMALMIAIANQIGPTVRVAQLHDLAKRAATTDGLTGVMNHRAFYLRLESMIAELDHWNDDLHLLIVDVIGLKAVNDVHGHLAGDRALKAIANALKGRVRGEDEIARYGGDEFVVIVRGTPRAGLSELVNRIIAPVEFSLDDGYPLTVRLRCGVATAHSSTERATELVARADAGLYTQVRPTEREDE